MGSYLIWPPTFSSNEFPRRLAILHNKFGSTDPQLDPPNEHSLPIWCEVMGAMRCLTASDILLFEARERAGLPQASLQGSGIPVPRLPRARRIGSLGVCILSRIRVGQGHAGGTCWTAPGWHDPSCNTSLAKNKRVQS